MADPVTLAAASGAGAILGSGAGKLIGKGKRRREKRDIRKILREGFQDIDRLVLRPFSQQFGGFLQGATGTPFGSVLGQGGQVGSQALGAISDALGFLKPGTSVPFGLNAPGVLQGLIGQAQGDIAQETQRGLRQVANLVPDFGGAAIEQGQDIVRQGASEAGRVAAGLRSRAAEQDLQNRLDLVRTAAGAFPAVGTGLSSLIGAGIAPFGFQQSTLDRILQTRAELAGTRAGFLGQEIAQANQNAGLLGQFAAMIPFLV